MRKKTTYLFLFLSFLVIILGSSYIIAEKTKNQVYNNLETIPRSEYGLVLGASKYGKNGLNVYFKYRMDATIELYSQGKIKKIIVSGDNHIKGYNEPLDMKNYLIDHRNLLKNYVKQTRIY